VSGPAVAIRCPAKVNLLLRVLGRRPDGYHELETVFQAVDVWDALTIRPSGTLTLHCDHPRLPVDESNLALRAAMLLRDRHGNSELGGRIVLYKTIPVEGGLGGGSSDAAASLLLCNRHWDLGVGRAELDALAAELGADVPFFLAGGTALGKGRGDCVEPLPFAGAAPVVLGCPPFGISTAEVFRRAGTRLTLPGNGVSVALLLAHKWPEDNDFRLLANDLEGVVFEGWPELKGFRDALLEAGAGAALLSGSGSTVFGVFTGPRTAARAAKRVQTRFREWRVLMTRFVPDGVRWDTPGSLAGRPSGEA
jgi:4-diphosphocytidyl-2-C-methyl-D-erythritol kinase